MRWAVSIGNRHAPVYEAPAPNRLLRWERTALTIRHADLESQRERVRSTTSLVFRQPADDLAIVRDLRVGETNLIFRGSDRPRSSVGVAVLDIAASVH